MTEMRNLHKFLFIPHMCLEFSSDSDDLHYSLAVCDANTSVIWGMKKSHYPIKKYFIGLNKFDNNNDSPLKMTYTKGLLYLMYAS